MEKSCKVYMVQEDGREVYLEKCRNREQAEMKCRTYQRQDDNERAQGYHCPAVRYIIK